MKYIAPEMEMEMLKVEDIMMSQQGGAQNPNEEPDMPTDEWD